MSIPFRPLGHIREAMEMIGLTVSHAHDDLVFIESNAILLQMGDAGEEVFLYFNDDSDESMRDEITTHVVNAGATQGLNIERKGNFSLLQEEGEDSFQIAFLG